MRGEYCDAAPRDWERSSIESICTRVTSGGTPSRRKPEYFVAGTIPWVKTQELNDGIIVDTDEHITEQAVEDSSAKWLPADTVLLALYGATVGQLAILSRPMTCNQACCAMVVDKSRADHRFLFYMLRAHRRQLKSSASGAAQQNLSGRLVRDFVLPFPSLPDQRAIASVLGALDDKIDLNRRMNETLEAMARAIFKSWFVDFDPVRAKAEGRQPFGMDAETAALFPDRLVESELGEIPEGWDVSVLGDVCDLSKDKVDPTELDPSVPYVGLEHVPRRSFAMEAMGAARQVNSTKASFAKHDVLFGKLRPYFHKVVPAFSAGICSTDILVLRPKASDLFAVTLLVASLDECVEYATQYSAGTRMPRINWKDLSGFRFALSLDVARELSRQCCESLALIDGNIRESRTLADLRDLLLPKLLSGEIRVKDAEKAVEAVA